MLRVHLAQIFYNPAYYESPVDYLEEPCVPSEDETPLGRLRSVQSIRIFLSNVKGSYLQHLQSKLSDVVRWSAERKAKILVFPEYSVPFHLLVAIGEIAQKHNMIIVAGTHRVAADSEAQNVYEHLGISSASVPLGSACAPTFLGDGTVHISTKLRRSKWESNLSIPHNEPKPFTFAWGGKSLRVAVIPCIDSLHPDVLGKLWSPAGNSPHLVLCPSLSPSTSHFHPVGSIAAMNEVLFAYVNSASEGGTFFNIPANWQSHIKGYTSLETSIPKDVEAVFEVDFNPEGFFEKRGSIKTDPICSRPVMFPIVYKSETNWLPGFVSLRSDLIEWLQASNKETAVDWLGSYLTDEAESIPALVAHNLKYLQHCILPLFDGNLDSVKEAFELVEISDEVENTQVFRARQVSAAIQLLAEYLPEATDETTDLVLGSMRHLKKWQQKLPPAAAVPPHKKEEPLAPMEATRQDGVFQGEEDLVEAFQDRGGNLDEIRNLLQNPDVKVIVVTGSIGIGKSEFLKWMFKKMLTDWKPIVIQMPHGGKIPRLVADVAFQLGMPIDIDSLASASHSVFREKIRKVLKHFYSQTKRALIIDDLHQLLRECTPRDERHVSTFIEEAAAPSDFIGGRVFIASSQWLPEKWLRTKGVGHLQLRGIEDIYTRRVIEYHMRKAGLVKAETVPEPPQELLDLVKGHPLSARLIVEALRETNFQELSRDLLVSHVSKHIAKELLKRVQLSDEDRRLMRRLSAFRLPVIISVLKENEGSWDISHILTLANRLILSYDGETVAMHEAIRRFFYEQTLENKEAESFHKDAVSYYEKLYEGQQLYMRKNPSILAELVHHLALCGEISKAKDLRLLVLEEIKPAARKVYREERNYHKALSLYKLLADITSDDPEVLAYVGRCYARLGQWQDCDSAFQDAIDTAMKVGKTTWWLYRDWGQIRARFRFYTEAKQHLDMAATRHPNNASIESSLGYLYWQQGDEEQAKEHFERGLQLNPYSDYTLTFYPKFLDSIGDYPYADTLRAKRAELDEDMHYRPPSEDGEIEDYDD